jgi:hypothetical protein
MTQSSTVVLERLSPQIARVVFSNPPANLIVPDAVSRLHDIVVAAERWGWVTLALPDAELNRFVEGLATRLTSFDRQALAVAEAQINRASLPPDGDLWRISRFARLAELQGAHTNPRRPACPKGRRRNRAEPRRLYRCSEELTTVDLSRPRAAIARD